MMDDLTLANLHRRLRLCHQPLDAGETLCVRGPVRSAPVAGDGPAIKAVMEQLQDWTEPAHIFELALRSGGPVAASATADLLTTARAVGALQEALFDDCQMLARIQMIPGSGLGPGLPDTTSKPPLLWVRGLTLRPQADGWHISSPLAPSEGWISTAALPTIPAAGWTPDPANEMLANLLSAAGLLVSKTTDTAPHALSTFALEMHAYSRRGTCRAPVGALGRASPVAAKPAGRIPLPDAETINDLSLGDLLSQRRSLRPGRQPSLPLSAQAIATVLWTAARNLGPPTSGVDGEPRIARPYPGAGGCHGLDLYLLLAAPPDSLPPLSRYDAAVHRLAPIDRAPDDLITGAGQAMGCGPPAGLIILAGRFEQLATRYGDAAYPLLLKETGTALQTLHLTCAAIGVQSCLLGGGDSRAFAHATGLDPAQEGPLGEIALTGLTPPQLSEKHHARA